MANKRVVLAFSGGLDTSYCVVFLKDQGYEVFTVLVNTGGLTEEESAAVRARSEELGAAKHIEIDARTELYDRYISYIIKSNYLRNGNYPTCVGVERCIQAEEVVKFALAEGAEAVAHGSTAAGGDHVRFDVAIRTKAPSLKIITPVRDDELKRETSSAYLIERGFHVDEKTTNYSINAGMMGTTIGGKETYTSWDYLPEEAWTYTSSIASAPADGVDLIMSFEEGLPVACKTLDGKEIAGIGPGTPSYSILTALNALAAEHGIGRGISTSITIMGNPARFGFEAPGILTIIAAHRELERCTQTPKRQNSKAPLATIYGDMLHEAMYYDPVMKDFEAFFDSSQQTVTGDVRLRLQKGTITPQGCRSEHSLVEAGRKAGANYGHSSAMWTGEEARAFAHIYSIAGVVAAAANGEEK